MLTCWKCRATMSDADFKCRGCGAYRQATSPQRQSHGPPPGDAVWIPRLRLFAVGLSTLGFVSLFVTRDWPGKHWGTIGASCMIGGMILRGALRLR